MFMRMTMCAMLLAFGGDPAWAGSAEKPANPVLVMETSHGTVELELWADRFPETAGNVLAYVDEKFYDGTRFIHKLADWFGVISIGAYDGEGKAKKGGRPAIKNECVAGLKIGRGSVRTFWDKGDTAGAGFLIVLKDKGETESRYNDIVFGQVLKGLDVLDSFGKLPKEARTFVKTIRRKARP